MKLLSGECHKTSLMINQFNIGSCNGFVASGNKPLPEPMLTQIYVTIWQHKVTMSLQNTQLHKRTEFTSFSAAPKCDGE